MATQKEVAEHLDLSLRHVQKLIKDGRLPPTKGRKGCDLESCRFAYIRYLRGLGSGQINSSDFNAPGSDSDSDDYAKLLEYEKYREKKRINDMEENKVAPVSLLTDALQKAANQIIPIFESLPLIMKRNFPELSGDQITLVKKSVAECRNIIAGMEFDLDS